MGQLALLQGKLLNTAPLVALEDNPKGGVFPSCQRWLLPGFIKMRPYSDAVLSGW